MNRRDFIKAFSTFCGAAVVAPMTLAKIVESEPDLIGEVGRFSGVPLDRTFVYYDEQFVANAHRHNKALGKTKSFPDGGVIRFNRYDNIDSRGYQKGAFGESKNFHRNTGRHRLSDARQRRV